MNWHENTLQRTQVLIAILAGTVTFIVGAYNTKNILFPKKEEPAAAAVAPAPKESPIRSAVEDAGAEWIRKKWGGKSESPPPTTQQ